MAPGSDQPYTSGSFRVHLGPGIGDAIGFSAVEFPDFVTADKDAAHGDVSAAARRTTLLLRRGFDGRLAIYDWWNASRASTAQSPRTVTIELLGDNGERPVVGWTFTGCRPVRLSYSPLDALASAVLMETLEVSFVEMSMA